MRDFFELRTDQTVDGEKLALSRISETEYHKKLLLEEQKNHCLKSARIKGVRPFR